MDAEQLARKFHDAYERLAPHYGYETRTDTRSFNPDSPNGRLMIAVCGEIIERLTLTDAEREAIEFFSLNGDRTPFLGAELHSLRLNELLDRLN